MKDWRYIASPRRLAALGVPRIDGRWDLRGLTAKGTERTGLRVLNFELLGTVRELKDFDIADVNLQGAVLPNVRLFRGSIRNVILEGARCHDWRVWATVVRSSSFRGADLSESAIAPVAKDGRKNRFEGVDFSGANLTGSAFFVGDFVDCVFDATRLDGVDFRGCRFRRCRFSGMLRDVSFAATSRDHPLEPPNEMDDVDFRGADLRNVMFRGLTLRRVRLPEDEERYLIVRSGYRGVVERAFRHLSDSGRGGAAFFGALLRAAAPDQQQGIISIETLMSVIPADDVQYIVRIVREYASEAGRTLHH